MTTNAANMNATTTPAAMTTNVAQQRITRDLRKAEHALDEALLRQSQLLSTMVHARRETGVAPYMGQDALMWLVRSQAATLNAGGELARVHGRLNDIAVETGVGNDPKPTPAFGLSDSEAEAAELAGPLPTGNALALESMAQAA
jgi:hypothetical protein